MTERHTLRPHLFVGHAAAVRGFKAACNIDRTAEPFLAVRADTVKPISVAMELRLFARTPALPRPLGPEAEVPDLDPLGAESGRKLP
jgi:hypothetical protein